MPDLRAEQTAGWALRVLLVGEQTEGRRLRAVLECCYQRSFVLIEMKGLEEACETLRANNFHLLVLDYGIVNTNGRDRLRLLRELAPSTPIILQASYRTRQVEADAARVGAEAALAMGDSHRLWQAVLQVTCRMEPGQLAELD
jgi:DNA-binding NarL/FixJ family response regulator